MSKADAPLKVLVAGATGYAGGHALRAVAAAGHEARALVRDPGGLGPLAEVAAEVAVAPDFTAPGALAPHLEGAHAVFSAVGLRFAMEMDAPTWPTVWEVDQDANVALLLAAREAGVKHFIFLSHIRADETRFELDRSAARERVVELARPSGMRWTVLRAAPLFNTVEALFEMCRQGTFWCVGGGRTRTNPLHGADLADLVVRSLTDASLQDVALDVGGPDTYTLREIASMAFDALGQKPKIRSMPPAAFGLATVGVRLKNANVARLMEMAGRLSAEDTLVGRPEGRHHLKEFFAELSRRR